MKARNGFVSNSSSTSFVVAIKEHTDKQLPSALSLIELVVDRLKMDKGNLKFFTGKARDTIANIDAEILALELDKKWVEKEKALWEKATSHVDLLPALRTIAWWPRPLRSKPPTPENCVDYVVRYKREMEELEETAQRNGEQVIKRYMESIDFRVKSIESDIEALRKRKKLYMAYAANDEWHLVGFTEDHYHGILEEMIEGLVRNNMAVIVEQKTV
jgi:hypothetical protein